MEQTIGMLIPYKKCGWHVMMKDTTVSNDTCNMTVRLYDGKTGRLIRCI